MPGPTTQVRGFASIGIVVEIPRRLIKHIMSSDLTPKREQKAQILIHYHYCFDIKNNVIIFK
jgi:hypothetical protein